MEARYNLAETSPAAYQAMIALEHAIHANGLEATLIHLIKLRASQINGCAYCLDMHWKDLRALGESEQRLYSLDAWREAPFYSPRERAALAWTEAITCITDGHAPDDLFRTVREQFSEQETADLTFVVATINSWNRLAIAARSVPGTYQSSLKPH